MYAAAGGASLASRQARQRQRQKQLQQLKSQKELKQHQPKQYHNYTDDAAGPKLSRVERGALRPPQGPHERRHSASNYHLKEPPKSRLKESPSISIPVQSHPPPPCTLVENHVVSSPSLQLPQILIPEGDGRLERRCSFVRQVEEMEKCQEGGLLDRCNHLCNFEIKDKLWETKYGDYEKDAFGSLDYPFSEVITEGFGHFRWFEIS
ncbi:hypothetical protein MTP99_018041 [Tenebrio molitor]|jgi:hypothetical protein|nr:hypothetical protein MTP99_018041 [Tenebrio molitor]